MEDILLGATLLWIPMGDEARKTSDVLGMQVTVNAIAALLTKGRSRGMERCLRSLRALSYRRSGFVRAIVAMTAVSATVSTMAIDSCVTEQKATTQQRARVHADQSKITNLRLGATTADLDRWVNTAEEQKRTLLKDTLLSGASVLTDGILESALKPTTIAGQYLPNGVGSLGPGQMNSIIGSMQDAGLNGPAALGLYATMHKLSLMRDKIGTVEYMQLLSNFTGAMKDAIDAERITGSVERAGALLQAAADFSGKANVAVEVGRALYRGAEANIVAYLLAGPAIQSLTGPIESQLNGLRIYSARLQSDVQALKRSEAKLADCLQNAKAAPLIGVDAQRQQLVTAENEALAASHRCADQAGQCVSACPDSAKTSGGSYISAVQACVASCGSCDAQYKTFLAASKRLDEYDLAQSRRQLEQARQRSK